MDGELLHAIKPMRPTNPSSHHLRIFRNNMPAINQSRLSDWFWPPRVPMLKEVYTTSTPYAKAFPYKQLTVLGLKKAQLGQPINVLSAADNLVTLIVGSSTPDTRETPFDPGNTSTQERHPHVLPSLQTLLVTYSKFEFLSKSTSLFHDFTSPNLHEASFAVMHYARSGVTWDVQPFVRMLERSGCPLRSLELAFWKVEFRPEHVLDILGASPAYYWTFCGYGSGKRQVLHDHRSTIFCHRAWYHLPRGSDWRVERQKVWICGTDGGEGFC
ncbi:hypothetical protein VNI00_004247 [Paramarasmius palmivorus]|uniref:Uncharacterized protein n=1 Tax=Paramarasmius palmivorus TaxID=297713 RepID=A0AAW0DNF4_9AGAR